MEGTAMSADSARRFLLKWEGRPQVNRVLHGFPSPRLWQPGAVDVGQALSARRRLRRLAPVPLALYIGVPFCIRTDPDRCGYCLFPVEVFEGAPQLDTYLGYLAQEGELMRPEVAGVELESLYIGGGTPNLMKPAHLERMMAIFRDVFPAAPAALPITLEGIPQLFTQAKLSHMRGQGVNRISMGVQQVDTELNRLSGRKQTDRHVFDAIGWCQALGLNCNVDLIFGWPQQTIATMLRDLARVVESGVDHIAHYELNIGGPTDFSLNRRHELPPPDVVREMYRLARDFLRAHGYRQLTTYDFQKVGPGSDFVYEECRRDCDRQETWGWGFAGVSDFGGTVDDPGCTFVNHRRLRDYYDALERGELPVERGFAREAVDLRLHVLFRNLQGMRVDRAGYARAFGLDVVAEHAGVWQALQERGWATVTPEAVELHGDGVYHTPLIQALLSEPRLTELKSRVAQLIPIHAVPPVRDTATGLAG